MKTEAFIHNVFNSKTSENSFSNLLAAKLDPEDFVRKGLALLESECRKIALLALADWEKTFVVTQDLFWIIASMQKPSWGTWNGLLDALRSARRIALRSANADERKRIEAAETLNAIIFFLEEKVETKLLKAAKEMGAITGSSVGKSVTFKTIFALPISLRNRIAHDSPSNKNWWKEAKGSLQPLIEFHARSERIGNIAGPSQNQSPWFINNKEKLHVFNGLADNFSARYVAKDGTSLLNAELGREVLLSFQRLLGKTDIEETNFRKLMAKLAPDDAKGVMMGDFLVGKPVGSGGFGTVHAGWQLSTGRKVAIKIIHDGLPEDAKFRFCKEAEFLSQFDHPNIVRVIGHYEEPWSAPRQFSLSTEEWFKKFSNSAPVKSFIAMEWVEGKTLEEIFQNESDQPSTDVITEWFSQAADAIQTVHSAGLIHRDIKPNNLMVSWDGTIKLMDFGIARTQDETRTLVTSIGQIMGTPVYMSPEQIRNSIDPEAEVGPSTDVYAVCATFYELYTRQRLFSHNTINTEEIKSLKLSGELPAKPRHLVSRLPWEIETILVGGLQAEISDRYKSMAHLERDLQNFFNNKPIEYKRPYLSRRIQLYYRRNKTIANAVVFFLLAIIFGSVFYVWSIKQEQSNTLRQLLALYEEQGRQELINGNPSLAAIYLSEAYNKGNNNPSLRLLLSQALEPIDSQIATLQGHTNPVYSTAFSPNEQLIITAGYDDTLKVWDSAEGKLLNTFELHTIEGFTDFWSYKLSLNTFSPDNNHIVIPASDNTAKILDVKNGDLVFTLKGHSDVVGSVKYSPNGKYIVTGSFDKTAIIWDAVNGDKLTQIKCDSQLLDVGFNPDNNLIFTQTFSTLYIWDINGKLIQEIKGYKAFLNSASFSPDGKRIVTSGDDSENSHNDPIAKTFWDYVNSSGGNNPNAKVFDVYTGQLLVSLKGHDNGLILSAEYSPNGLLIVTASLDNTAKVWRASDGKLLSTLKGHTGWVTSAIFSQDNKKIVTISDDKTARIWDSINGQLLTILEGHKDKITSVAFNSKGDKIVTASLDGTAKLWRAKGKLLNLQGDESSLESASLCSDGHRIVTTNQNRVGEVSHIENSAPLFNLKGEILSGTILFSPDCKFILATGNRETGRLVQLEFAKNQPFPERIGVFKVWDATNGTELFSNSYANSTNISEVEISPNSQFFIVKINDAKNKKDKLEVRSLLSGNIIISIEENEYYFSSFKFSPNSTQIVATSFKSGSAEEATLSIWQVSNGTLSKRWKLLKPNNNLNKFNDYKGSGDNSLFAEFSPEGKRILSVNSGIDASIWDSNSGQLLFTLNGHTDDIYSAEFSSDSKYIVTASEDNTVRIWDGQNGKALNLINLPASNGISDSSLQAKISPDDNFILTYGGSREVKLFGMATGKFITALDAKAEMDDVSYASFSSNGQRVLTKTIIGAVRVWDIHLENRTPPQIAELIEKRIPFRLENGNLVSNNLISK